MRMHLAAPSIEVPPSLCHRGGPARHCRGAPLLAHPDFAAGRVLADTKEMFHTMDTDCSGALSLAEFKRVARIFLSIYNLM